MKTAKANLAARFWLLLFAFCLLPARFLPSALAQTIAPGPEPSRESHTNLASESAKRGEELRRRWNLDAAESAFRESVALDPASLEATIGLARIARAKIDYASAIELLEASLKHHPNSTEALAEIGLTYLAAEEHGRAALYFEKALTLDFRHEPSITGQAGADLLAREYHRAESRLRHYLQRNAESSRARAMLARVLVEMNKNAEAAREAERAIALDAYNADAIYTLAFVRASERKPDEVRALARRAVALDPLNAGARRLLSQYIDGRKGYEQKVAVTARLAYERGRALKREGKLDEAVAEFESALAIEPRYYRALVALGDVWLKAGDYERAATAARLAIEIDPDGSVAQLELSYAHRGMEELARIEIGATDFSSDSYNEPAPPSFALTAEIFPNYRMLARRQQSVVDRAVAPLAGFLPALSRHKARHYLLAYDERVSDVDRLEGAADDKTFDGRYFASIRGVGGRITVSGIEYIETAARGGFHTIAHELAHQVHLVAMGKEDVKEIRRLYEAARREGRTLDYYAAANEYEYFAQGYEAFVSRRKRPSAGVTARHTKNELLMRDPQLYKFISKLAGRAGAGRAAVVSHQSHFENRASLSGSRGFSFCLQSNHKAQPVTLE